MAKGLKERKDMDPKYMWDLSLIYKTSEDWEKDLKDAKKEMQKFLAFKGNLNNPKKVKAVSYTHLTLPTKRIV